jgi:hypothetical protein
MQVLYLTFPTACGIQAQCGKLRKLNAWHYLGLSRDLYQIQATATQTWNSLRTPVGGAELTSLK